MASLITAAVLVIGNEILSGRTHDTNTHTIAARLGEKGIVLREARVIPDDHDVIISTVRFLSGAFTHVFSTGGIGPTHDDITAECMAQAFDAPLHTHPDAFRILEAHYGADQFTQARQKMALIPKGAALIPNPVSAAPGFIIRNVYVMAGIPKIMVAMLDHVMTGIAGGPPVLSRTVTTSVGESYLAQGLGHIQADFPDLSIGSYPHMRDGKVGVALVARGTDATRLDAAEESLNQLVASFNLR